MQIHKVICDQCDSEREASGMTVKVIRNGIDGWEIPERQWDFCDFKCAAAFFSKQQVMEANR